MVLSDYKLEEPAATEAVGSSETEQRTEANTPVRRQSKRETKSPSYLKDFQLK